MLMQYLFQNIPTIFQWCTRSVVELYIQFVTYLSHLTLFHEFTYIVFFSLLLLIVAFELQYHLNRRIGLEVETSSAKAASESEAKKNKPVQTDLFYRRRWLYEGFYSIVAIGWMPLVLPFILLRFLYRKLKQIFGYEKKYSGNYLVVSTGPSYLLSILVITMMYVVGVLLDPLLASQVKLSSGSSFWEYLFFGSNTSFGGYLPLIHHPNLSLAIHFIAWTTIWWTLAQCLRLMNADAVFRNSIDRVQDVIVTRHPKDHVLLQFTPGFLSRWRDWSGHRDAWKLSYSNRWHGYGLPIGALSLLLGFLLLDADPYRLPSGIWVIGWLSWLSILLNLSIQGVYSYTESESPAPPKSISYRRGWPEVAQLLQAKGTELEHRYHFVPPDIHSGRTQLSDVSFLNPLFSDLRKSNDEPWTLHSFQMEMLTRFHQGLQKYTTVTIGMQGGSDLALGQEFVYNVHSDKRAWLSIWPDGYGKTESIFIHACHFYLTTSQRTIILTRSNEQADAMYKQFQQMLAGNTLRWSIPIAIADVEFFANVQDQYYPAVLIASVEQISLQLLTKISSRSDVPLTQYLSTVGLIQFDNLENYLGVVEQHVSFIFRRLLLQLYRSRNLPFGTPHWEPFVLGFSNDSMFNQRVWASNLIGIDFEIYHPLVEVEHQRVNLNLSLPKLRIQQQEFEKGMQIAYPVEPEPEEQPELTDIDQKLAELEATPENVEEVVDALTNKVEQVIENAGLSGQEGESKQPKETPEQKKQREYKEVLETLQAIPKQKQKETPIDGHIVIKYNLNDVKGVSFYDIIDACERLEVPWTYQLCGDGNREIGLKNLYLSNEPRFFTNDMQSAAVILLTGHYVEVERDLSSRVLLGTGFCQFQEHQKNAPELGLTPIAVFAQYDQFEYETFTSREQDSIIPQYPLPLVRKAGHWVLRTHFASDIVRFWLEVNDVVKVFGVEGGHIIQRLQHNNLLMLESHRVINESVSDYTNFVVVRAKRTALPQSKSDAKNSYLPTPLTSVEVASNRSVEVFDQAGSRVISRVDVNSAVLKYYLGRIWSTYFGHFIVKEYIFLEGADENGKPTQELKKIIVEPTLDANVSTPRREFQFAERPNQKNEMEYRLYGDYGIGFALQSYSAGEETESRYKRRTSQCVVRHKAVATLYLDPASSIIKERRLLTRKETDQMKHLEQLHTDGLWVYPTYSPKEEIESAKMTLGAARIFIAIWRMLLPNIYRGGNAVELALSIKDELVSLSDLEYVFTSDDALVLFDLQEEGCGVVHCIHREAILTLLEWTYSFMTSCSDIDTFMRLFDHCPDESELFKGIKPLDWTSSCEQLVSWLKQVLPIADDGDTDEPDPTPVPTTPPTDPKSPLSLLDLDDSYAGATTDWHTIVETIAAQTSFQDESSLLQVRLLSRDRTIESFVPSFAGVQQTNEGLNLDLPRNLTQVKEQMVGFFETLSQASWNSPVQVWAHVFQRAYEVKQWTWDTPTIGENGPYAVMDFTETETLLGNIIPNSAQVARSTLAERLNALCTIFDWMHLNIRYETDDVLYNAKEYIARPTETLTAKAGDCEDHANLIASFALGIGLVPRITLLEGHALCEVYLGNVQSLDLQLVKDTIQQYMARRCQEFGIEFGQWPFSQTKVADGWLLNGMSLTKKTSSTQISFYPFDMSTLQIIQENGECWIALDDCFGGVFVGDIHKHIEKGFIYPGSKNWDPEKLHGYHYPSTQMIEEVRARYFVTKDMDVESPPTPTHIVFRGGLTNDGLQRFEVLDVQDVDWVEPRQIEVQNVSDQERQEMDAWVPYEERYPEPEPEVEASGEPNLPEMTPDSVDTEDVSAISAEEVEEASNPEEGTVSEDGENKTPSTSSDEPSPEVTEPEPPLCTVDVMDWQVFASDVPKVNGAHGQTTAFTYKGEHHTVQWGFDTPEALKTFEVFQSVDTVRTPEIMLSKEPYAESLSAIVVHLQALYGGHLDSLFAEFVLAFVQALPTAGDTNKLSRTPSETVMFGGSSADKSLLLHLLLQYVGIPSQIVECEEDKFANVVKGQFGGYHLKIQDIPMYFADVGHLTTGIGYCKWLTMQECTPVAPVAWHVWPGQIFLTSRQEGELYIQAIVPISEKSLWVRVDNLDSKEHELFKLDITSVEEGQRGLIKIAIRNVTFDQWSIKLFDREQVFGVLSSKYDRIEKISDTGMKEAE